MSRKRNQRRNAELVDLGNALVQNGLAVQEGPKRKTWNPLDIRVIKPLKPTQEEMFHAWQNLQHMCVHGSAGTGKTFLACYLALQEVLAKSQQRIIIVRSAVPTREVGYLPGTLEEKMQQYEEPYRDIMWELIGKSSTYQDMKEAGLIEFHSTSFLRGLTWDNAIVIIEEAENLTFHEIDSVMTRLGDNTRVIITGDTKQTDLDGSKRMGAEGLSQAISVFDKMGSFSTIKFNVHDIVRSETVKSWIMACEDLAA